MLLLEALPPPPPPTSVPDLALSVLSSIEQLMCVCTLMVIVVEDNINYCCDHIQQHAPIKVIIFVFTGGLSFIK
jgi:hypothetical protein